MCLYLRKIHPKAHSNFQTLCSEIKNPFSNARSHFAGRYCKGISYVFLHLLRISRLTLELFMKSLVRTLQNRMVWLNVRTGTYLRQHRTFVIHIYISKHFSRDIVLTTCHLIYCIPSTVHVSSANQPLGCSVQDIKVFGDDRRRGLLYLDCSYNSIIDFSYAQRTSCPLDLSL